MPLDGVLCVLKPPGMTSHDVVSYLRTLTGNKRVGHTGTLDPDACGVLPVCLGRATRLSEYMMESDKSYRAEMVLGVSTSTGDASGEVISKKDSSHIDTTSLKQAVANFSGIISQHPPMYSAVKFKGKPLYEYARSRKRVEMPPRKVQVHHIEIIRFQAGENPRVLMDVSCSKGTYIRSLCSDIGDWLGTGGHLRFLLRTYAAGIDITSCYTLEYIKKSYQRGRIDKILKSMAESVNWFSAVTIKPGARTKVRNGRPLGLSDIVCDVAVVQGTKIRVLDERGELLAIGEVNPYFEPEPTIKLRKMLMRDD